MSQEPSPAVPPARPWSHQLPEEAFALYLTMEQGWPTVFSLSHPTPLKIGIDVDILAALSCDPARLGQVLRWYTRRIAYFVGHSRRWGAQRLRRAARQAGQ